MKISKAKTSILATLACLSIGIASPAIADEWDEEEEEEESEEEEEEEEEEQPPVWSGGLYRKDNYPIAALQRPLTLNRNLLEIRGALEADVSKDRAFDAWYTHLDARYGITDEVQVHAGFSTLVAGNATQGGAFEVGVENAIYYNLVNFRANFEIPFRPCCGYLFSFGFPIRYVPKPQVAIIALDKLVTLNLEGGDPDLTVGVGGIFQPHPIIAIVVRGELILPGFEPDALQIPVRVAAQVTPTRMLDLGLEFTLANVKDENDRLANRSVLIFAQFRL